MPYEEEDLLPISALQHFVYCPRQCALGILEQQWQENRLTAEGRLLHKNAESGKSTTRNGVRITRDLPLHNFQLGLTGKADIVEFHPPAGLASSAVGRTLRQIIQHHREDSLVDWTIMPVEYKRGQPKVNDCDRVQLCAQAMCLEEMLNVSIPLGYLFYGQKQHRYEVLLDETLRKTTADLASELHQLIIAGKTPPAEYGPKCNSCAQYDICLPKLFATSSASNWLKQQLKKSF